MLLLVGAPAGCFPLKMTNLPLGKLGPGQPACFCRVFQLARAYYCFCSREKLSTQSLLASLSPSLTLQLGPCACFNILHFVLRVEWLRG